MKPSNLLATYLMVTQNLKLNEETHLKCAAVLVPLVWQNDEWHLLFTRRTDKVESHKGQVSFPGGACDEGETTPEQTALREADEEIGIQPNDIKSPWKIDKPYYHFIFPGDASGGSLEVAECISRG